MRLVLPISPDWVLRSMGLWSLVTAVYAAGMALIQRDARRFFCYLFLSHSALVLVGLEMVTPIGLTGALCVWLSIGLALGGFGLTLRALEARRGRLSLDQLPRTCMNTRRTWPCAFCSPGWRALDFRARLALSARNCWSMARSRRIRYVGVAMVVAAALNGIAIVKAYFRLFTGSHYQSSVPLWLRARERYGVLTLAGLIQLAGFFPQPGVTSRYQAAEELLAKRAALGIEETHGKEPAGENPSATDEAPAPTDESAR